MVAGIFDDRLLEYRQCDGLELCRAPLCCAVSLSNPLAEKDMLEPDDLHGQNLMILERGQMEQMDILRDDLARRHPQIHIVNFDFYSTETFNQCENGSDILVAVANWQNVHPLLKIIPVNWNHAIPFGLLHSSEPSPAVRACIEAVVRVYNLEHQMT